jgi:hypothetical protein
VFEKLNPTDLATNDAVKSSGMVVAGTINIPLHIKDFVGNLSRFAWAFANVMKSQTPR